jgi:hypothetical protein
MVGFVSITPSLTGKHGITSFARTAASKQNGRGEMHRLEQRPGPVQSIEKAVGGSSSMWVLAGIAVVGVLYLQTK